MSQPLGESVTLLKFIRPECGVEHGPREACNRRHPMRVIRHLIIEMDDYEKIHGFRAKAVYCHPIHVVEILKADDPSGLPLAGFITPEAKLHVLGMLVVEDETYPMPVVGPLPESLGLEAGK